jgi:hypothetical protein
MTKKKKYKILAVILPIALIVGIAAVHSSALNTVQANGNDNSDWNYNDNNRNNDNSNNYQNDYNPNDYNFSFSSQLSGSQETPPLQTDMNGQARFFVSNNNEIDYDLDVFNGKDVTEAHLHCAVPGQPGPIVVGLFNGGPQNVDGELASGTITSSSIASTAKNCATPITSLSDLVSEIKKGNIYVNVHTSQNPQGEIRGQLSNMMNLNGNGQNNNSNYFDNNHNQDYNNNYNNEDTQYHHSMKNSNNYNGDRNYYNNQGDDYTDNQSYQDNNDYSGNMNDYQNQYDHRNNYDDSNNYHQQDQYSGRDNTYSYNNNDWNYPGSMNDNSNY